MRRNPPVAVPSQLGHYKTLKSQNETVAEYAIAESRRLELVELPFAIDKVVIVVSDAALEWEAEGEVKRVALTRHRHRLPVRKIRDELARRLEVEVVLVLELLQMAGALSQTLKQGRHLWAGACRGGSRCRSGWWHGNGR